MAEEKFLDGEDFRFVEEYGIDKFVCAVWGKPDIILIDRTTAVTARFKPKQQLSDQNLSIQLLPGFDADKFPYAFVMTQSGLLLVDVRRG